MSYDYSLFKALGSGPMESWPATQPASLGTVDEVKRKLADAFPDIVWENSDGTWFGRAEDQKRYAEFQITPERDNGIRFITVRRTEREEIENLCRLLDVVAVDPQKMELYSCLTGSWSRTN